MPRERRSYGGRHAPAPAPRHAPSRNPAPAPRHAPSWNPAPAPRHAPSRNPPLQTTVNHDPPPAPVQASGPPAPVQDSSGGLFGDFNSAMAVGMLLGRAFPSQQETVVSQTASPSPSSDSMGGADVCSVQSKEFQNCLKSSESDISKCQKFMDLLAECKRKSGSMAV